MGGSPFWSADGRRLGFFAYGKLKTVEVSGGPNVDLTDAPVAGGGSWKRDGALLFVPDFTEGLSQEAASGGAPVPVFKLDPSKYMYYAWPKFLPDGKHFLYRAWAHNPAFSGTYLATLDGKENQLLLNRDSRATYVSGYLLYLLDRTLMAHAFDPERGQLKGEAHPVAERVASDSYRNGFFDASENGVLIYQAGGSPEEKRFTWFDRTGKELGAGKGGSYETLRLSPDGSKLAFNAGETNHVLWVEELTRGVRMPITNNPETYHGSPTWSPDGSRIVFSAGGESIYQMNSTGVGDRELLLAKEPSDPGIWPTSWSPDGRFVLFVRGNSDNPRQYVWVLPLVGDRKPRLFVPNAYDGQFSPDGRWVAYTSHESGEGEIYVVPFDGNKILTTDPGSITSPGGKTLISASRGAIARWRGTARKSFTWGWATDRLWQQKLTGEAITSKPGRSRLSSKYR